MTCDQALPLLEAFGDGEMGWGTARRVRRHLAGCPACALELAEVRQLDARVRAWRDVPAPASLQSRIAAALPSAPPASVPRRPAVARRAAIGLAGFAAAVAAAVWLLPGQPGRPTIALADVEQAMASVKTMTSTDDNTFFDKNGKIVAHYVDQQWTRRDPPALARIHLSGSLRLGEAGYKQVLEDGRGQMTVMSDGSYLFIDDSPENLKSIPSSFNLSTQTLSFMASLDKIDKRVGRGVMIQGERTTLDGEAALKFEHTWHRKALFINTPTLRQRLPVEDSETTIWLNPRTYRMMRMDGRDSEDGKLTTIGSSTHFRYDETPPPGIFDMVPPPGAKIKDLRVRRK